MTHQSNESGSASTPTNETTLIESARTDALAEDSQQTFWRAPAALPVDVAWYTCQGAEVLRQGDLGAILGYYLSYHRLTHAQLGERIHFDPSYISHLKSGRKTSTSLSTLNLIASQLGVPNSFLGLDGAGQHDHQELFRRGESVIRLSVAAREAGRPSEALRELDLLVTALEARARDAIATRQDMVLLATARAEVGVALGDLLPEAHLVSATQWTNSGARVLADLGDEPGRSAHALRMYGNELRKAGRLPEAVTILRRALVTSPDLRGQATASLLLARAASEAGHAALFDHCIAQCRQSIDQDPGISNFFLNPFSLREVELRGLLLTARNNEAERVANRASESGMPPPTWNVLERVTMAQFHLATGDTDTAAADLRTAIDGAQSLRLPHQIERAVRLARSARLNDLVRTGTKALCRTPTLPEPAQSRHHS
ncbi:helix-turn-helix domain-containing protein [Streptomyces nodosus]